MGIIRWLFGSKEEISSKAMIHSTIGEFSTNGRLLSGGHSQKNIDELRRRRQIFNIEKIYSNGVRIGNVPNQIKKSKRTGTSQSRFPKNWNDGIIKKTAQTISRGRKRKDGEIKNGHYNKVNVGVIRTNGIISTIFPMKVQKNKKGVTLNERKKTKRINRKKQNN